MIAMMMMMDVMMDSSSNIKMKVVVQPKDRDLISLHWYQQLEESYFCQFDANIKVGHYPSKSLQFGLDSKKAKMKINC